MQASLKLSGAPLLAVSIGDRTLLALLDTGSSVSLLGDEALQAAVAARSKPININRSLRLAAGTTTATAQVKVFITWPGGERRHRFLYLPGLEHALILGRDFLHAVGMSLHTAEGGWTLGTAPQCVIPFAKRISQPQMEHFSDAATSPLELNRLFATEDNQLPTETMLVQKAVSLTLPPLRARSFTSAGNRDARMDKRYPSPAIPPKVRYKLTEIVGDIFLSPNCTPIVHCVAQDMRMTKGFAASVTDRYGGRAYLLSQKTQLGGMATQVVRGRPIFYLVTKRASSDKPRLGTIVQALRQLKKFCKYYDIQEISMPRIASGLDGIKWSAIKKEVANIFRDTEIAVTVFVPPPNAAHTTPQANSPTGCDGPSAEAEPAALLAVSLVKSVTSSPTAREMPQQTRPLSPVPQKIDGQCASGPKIQVRDSISRRCDHFLRHSRRPRAGPHPGARENPRCGPHHKPQKVAVVPAAPEVLRTFIVPGAYALYPDKVAAIPNLPTPTQVKELQSILGPIGYYRPFLRAPSCANKSAPLTNLQALQLASRAPVVSF
jgi:predicted aspartyl protease